MKLTKQTFIIAFALFSLFFGAGNLILPPYLGYQSGQSWLLVALGFALTGVLFPILGVYGHALLQGTLLDFGKKVSKLFSLVYAICIYAVSVAIPAPRTASVTYELAFSDDSVVSSIGFSGLYFFLVLLFVLNRSKILDIMGRFITPIILGLLLLIVGIGLNSDMAISASSMFDNSFSAGFIEGYQTFDAIGGVVAGGVIVVSLSIGKNYSYIDKKRIIANAGVLAGLALFLVYIGLIYLGALYQNEVQIDSRTALLTYISNDSLGGIGATFLAVLVGLACFTTAVGIVTGTADFMRTVFKNSNKAYRITVVVACLLGVLVGQLDVHTLIVFAIPVLKILYPITIVLILLVVFPKSLQSVSMYRWSVLAVILGSLPEVFKPVLSNIEFFKSYYNLQIVQLNIGWFIPVLVVILAHIILKKRA